MVALLALSELRPPTSFVLATTATSPPRRSFVSISQKTSLLHSASSSLLSSSSSSSWQRIPRGGAQHLQQQRPVPPSSDAAYEPAIAPVVPVSTVVAAAATSLPGIVVQAWTQMMQSFQGGKGDTLLLLIVTFLVPTLCNSLPGGGLSPILGFLFSGVALGPQGANLVANVHTTELLADIGVVLFLFEMGVHLSMPVLWQMRNIVFGLGGAQMA